MAGLYIHVPFCLRKCLYCDFYSVEGTSKFDFYLHGLEQEMRLRSDNLRDNFTISTIFFGGGTPSLLLPEQLQRIMQRISESFSLSDEKEVTLEVNPATLSETDLKAFEGTGVNRLSVGVQSFRDKELSLLGRLHTAHDAEAFVKSAIQSAISEISIDLIYGLPNQTLDDWDATLQKAVSLKPPHISAYTLTWNETTPMGKAITSGQLPVPDEDEVIEMVLHTASVLCDAGYEQYEISNFALPGHRCRHNEGYWKGDPYIGLGPSAHSYLGTKRSWNVSDVDAYCNMISQNRLPVENEECLTPEAMRLEKIALGLRCSEGVSINHLNVDSADLNDYIKQGLATRQDGNLVLTQKGLLLADEIALQLS